MATIIKRPAAAGNANDAELAQTCFGMSGRFWPMIRPLFQALRFGVTARNWTLDIVGPPIFPPDPDISTALTIEVYWLSEWRVSEYAPFECRNVCIWQH